MSRISIVSAGELALHLDDPDWVVIDCRFSLRDLEKGLRDYLNEHIYGAYFADLEKDLSGEIIPGKTGRHPLPPAKKFLEVIFRWGVTNESQIVVYDDVGGAFAARLWWMFRWVGHEGVALLDGGWQVWIESGLPTKKGFELPGESRFTPRLDNAAAVSTETVDEWRISSENMIIDAREAERYRGEVEPIDRIAGRIPGAISFPYRQNLDPEGFFRQPEDLRRPYEDLLKGVPPQNAACYCGSGVTAALNLVGMVHAGLECARLYPGSYSEWIIGDHRPVARG